MMNATSSKINTVSRVLKVLRHTIGFLVIAFAIGWLLNRIGHSLSETPRPAGFGRGIVQGALMPMALPNLLVGKDVAIYALNNTGIGYKLGYTAGVNSCGAIFFGFFFWRLRRLKKWADARES